MKKDIQNRLRASVQAEDQAVKDRFSGVDSLLEETGTTAGKASRAPAATRARAGAVADSDPAHPPLSREDARVIRRVRDRFLKQGITLTRSELALAGFYALLRASDQEIHETVEQLRRGSRGRPVFPSGRGNIRLSRLD